MTSLRIIAVLCLILTITLCTCEGKNIPVDETKIHFYFDDDGFVQLSPESAKGRNGIERWWAKTLIRSCLLRNGIPYNTDGTEYQQQIFETLRDWSTQFNEFIDNTFGLGGRVPRIEIIFDH